MPVRRGPGIPQGKTPTLKQTAGGSEVVDVRCPNGHAAGLGQITPAQLGIALCPTDSAVLVTVVALLDDRTVDNR